MIEPVEQTITEAPPIKDGLRDLDEGSYGHDPRPIAEAVVPVPAPQVGLWQCLAPKGCEPAQKREPFEGPLQSAAKDLGAPIQCPTCGNINVIYSGDKKA